MEGFRDGSVVGKCEGFVVGTDVGVIVGIYDGRKLG